MLDRETIKTLRLIPEMDMDKAKRMPFEGVPAGAEELTLKFSEGAANAAYKAIDLACGKVTSKKEG